jgi:hypothetical protein
MVQFSVPVTTAGNKRRQAFAFCVKENAVLFAGSRNGFVPEKTAHGLVSGFARLGFSFVVGCASGIDRCFRKALAASEHTDKTFVACAFVKRIGHIMDTGLFASCVVPHGIPPKAALARRTLWMVKRASLIVLFPDNPENGRWGKGSTLVFNAAVMQLKPLFVVTKHQPEQKGIYRVLPACFQGLIEGYWVIPHPIQKGGTCDDEY